MKGTFIIIIIPGLNELKIVHSHDMKVIINLAGIQSSSSKYPCPYCHWISTYNGKNDVSKPAKPAKLRTFDSVRDNYNKWMTETGGNKKKAMDYYNCTELPLVPFEKDELIIERFPPPELHIFCGIFNHIYDGMIANPDMHDCVEKWSNDVGVTRQFCPGHAFVGNHCSRLLKKIDLLLETRPPRSIHKEQFD